MKTTQTTQKTKTNKVLDFVDRTLDRAIPVDAVFVQRLRDLTGGVEVDLEESLSDDESEEHMEMQDDFAENRYTVGKIQEAYIKSVMCQIEAWDAYDEHAPLHVMARIRRPVSFLQSAVICFGQTLYNTNCSVGRRDDIVESLLLESVNTITGLHLTPADIVDNFDLDRNQVNQLALKVQEEAATQLKRAARAKETSSILFLAEAVAASPDKIEDLICRVRKVSPQSTSLARVLSVLETFPSPRSVNDILWGLYRFDNVFDVFSQAVKYAQSRNKGKTDDKNT